MRGFNSLLIENKCLSAINNLCAGLSIRAMLATIRTSSSSSVVTHIRKEKLESGECIIHVTCSMCWFVY